MNDIAYVVGYGVGYFGGLLLVWVVFLKVTIWAVRGSLGNVKKDREDKK